MQIVHHLNQATKGDRWINHLWSSSGTRFTSTFETIRSGHVRKRLPHYMRIVLVFVLFGSGVGCVERPKGRASADAPAEQRVDTSAISKVEAQQIKREAFNQLQPLIRRFDRKKVAYELSEQQYLEKLYLWTLTFGMLEMRSNPGTFAGDLPEHEMFPFSDYAESAESLLGDLTIYLNRFAADSDPETQMLLRKKEEASVAVQLNFPGCGSRLQDAIVAMRSAKFKSLVNASNARLADLGMVGGEHFVKTVTGAAGKVLSVVDAFLNATKR